MLKFSKTQKFTKKNIDKVPTDKAIVYKIKNPANKNLYTGIAGRGRGKKRLLEHKDRKNDRIPGGTKFQIAQVKDKKRAEKVEKQIIRKEKPKFNKEE